MTDLLTPKEVADILRINYRKVLDLIALGDLRAYRVGRVFRVSRNDLLRYMQSARVHSPWGNRV